MRAKKATVGTRVHIIAGKDASKFGMITDFNGKIIEVTSDSGSKSTHSVSELHAETTQHIEQREALAAAEAEARKTTAMRYAKKNVPQ